MTNIMTSCDKRVPSAVDLFTDASFPPSITTQAKETSRVLDGSENCGTGLFRSLG
jgi:hypothetical protein